MKNAIIPARITGIGTVEVGVGLRVSMNSGPFTTLMASRSRYSFTASLWRVSERDKVIGNELRSTGGGSGLSTGDYGELDNQILLRTVLSNVEIDLLVAMGLTSR